MAQVTSLIPGLLDLPVMETPDSSVSAVTFGRMDASDDRIKQGRPALSAFAAAVRAARESSDGPSSLGTGPIFTMVGIEEEK